MSANIAGIFELKDVLSDKDKTVEGVLQFITSFKITRLLGSFDSVKTKGINVSTLLLSLITFRLTGGGVTSPGNAHLNILPRVDDNTFYRLMNNPLMNWRSLLWGFAKQFAKHVKEKGDNDTAIRCFVIDDTDLQKTGKKIEFIGRIFNHVTKTYPFGFKMLLLAYWDGKSLTSLDFSLHSEKGKKGNYGLKPGEREAQFSKQREAGTPSATRVKELDSNKNENALAMLRRAVKNGFAATHVLVDSWFVNDTLIKGVRAIKSGSIHVLGMCKMDARKYLVGGKELNASQIITKFERKSARRSRKYKSRYIPVVAEYKGTIVRLFMIQYGGSSKWTILLTTDMSLSFVDAVELYQVRWTIEVLFKECKQYLRLGCSQNTDFDGQVADTTLALVTHTVLSIQKRFGSYETMGDLFRATQKHLLELTLWEKFISILLDLMLGLLEILNVDIEELMNKLMGDDHASKKLFAMLATLKKTGDNS
jgi:hypothetical protein